MFQKASRFEANFKGNSKSTVLKPGFNSFYGLEFNTEFVVLVKNPQQTNFISITLNLNDKPKVVGYLDKKNTFFYYKVQGEREIHIHIEEMSSIFTFLVDYRPKQQDFTLETSKKVDQIFTISNSKKVSEELTKNFENLSKHQVKSCQETERSILQNINYEIQKLSNSLKNIEELLDWAELKFETFQFNIIDLYFKNLKRLDYIKNFFPSHENLDSEINKKNKSGIITILHLIQDKSLDKIQGEITEEQAKRKKTLNAKIQNIEKSINQLK